MSRSCSERAGVSTGHDNETCSSRHCSEQKATGQQAGKASNSCWGFKAWRHLKTDFYKSCHGKVLWVCFTGCVACSSEALCVDTEIYFSSWRGGRENKCLMATQIHNVREGGKPVWKNFQGKWVKFCNDHFRGRETLKHPVNLPKFLSLHCPFRARNGGGKCISCGFPLLLMLWCINAQKAQKAFICFSHKENLQTVTSSGRNAFIQCNGTAFIAWTSFLHYNLLLVLTQRCGQSLLMGSNCNVFKIMC